VKVLIVGGKFDLLGGRPSGLVAKVAVELTKYVRVEVFNGGPVNIIRGLCTNASGPSSPGWDESATPRMSFNGSGPS